MLLFCWLQFPEKNITTLRRASLVVSNADMIGIYLSYTFTAVFYVKSYKRHFFEVLALKYVREIYVLCD